MSSAAASGRRLLWVYALLLFVVVAWGGSFVAARMLLNPSSTESAALSPTGLATIRFCLASAVFLPILVASQVRRHSLKARDIPVFLLLGQLGISAYFWLQYTGVQLTNAGISAVLVVGVIPLATMLVSGMSIGESWSNRRALALAIGAVGVVVVGAQRGLQFGNSGGFLFGTLCLIADAFAFAIYSTLIRGIRERFDSLTVTGWMMVSGTGGLLLLAMLTGELSEMPVLSLDQWAAVAYLSLVCSVLGYFFYNYALSRIEASKAAVWIYLEPPVAVLLGWAMLGEALTLQTIAGAVLIGTSLVVAQRS